MEELKQLITQKKKDLEQLPKPTAVVIYSALCYCCWGCALLLLGFGIPGCVVDSGGGAWEGWPWMFWIGILMAILGAIFGAREKIVAKLDKSPEAVRLEKELAALRSKLRALSSAKKELAQTESELATFKPDRFGCSTTEELSKLRDARRELMQRIMGSEPT